MGTYIEQGPILMCLLTITCLHMYNKASVVTNTTDRYFDKYVNHTNCWLTLRDVIILLTPFLQTVQHQFSSFSPFWKWRRKLSNEG